MKATTHIALLAVSMYGLISVTYLYGQSRKSSTAADAAAAPTAGDPWATSNDANSQPKEYRTIRIEHADASLLAKQLKDLNPNSAIVGDARTNQILIHGSKDEIETALSLIKQLDVPEAEKPNFAQSGEFGFGIAQPAMPKGASTGASLRTLIVAPNSPLTSGENVSSAKVWQDYANLVAGADEPVQKEVLKMHELLDQLRASGKLDSAKELQGHIDHLLNEQLRRANENAKRVAEQISRMDTELKRAVEANDEQRRQAAEQARLAAQDLYVDLERTQRTIEQLQKLHVALNINAEAIDSKEAAMQLAEECKKLAAIENPSADENRDLQAKKAQLKTILSAQVDERQKQESEALKQLRKRLDKLEKEMSDRVQNREKIINGRFDELTSASAPDAATTITTPNLTLENVEGADKIQFRVTPEGITLTRPVPPVAPVPPVKTDVRVSTKAGQAPAAPEATKSSDAADPPPPAQP